MACSATANSTFLFSAMRGNHSVPVIKGPRSTQCSHATQMTSTGLNCECRPSCLRKYGIFAASMLCLISDKVSALLAEANAIPLQFS